MEQLRNTSDYARCVNAKIENSLLLVPKSEIWVKPRKLQRYIKQLASHRCGFKQTLGTLHLEINPSRGNNHHPLQPHPGSAVHRDRCECAGYVNRARQPSPGRLIGHSSVLRCFIFQTCVSEWEVRPHFSFHGDFCSGKQWSRGHQGGQTPFSAV